MPNALTLFPCRGEYCPVIRLSAYRAHIALLLVLMMLVPLGVQRATAAPMHHGPHDSTSASTDEAAAPTGHVHDRLSCSIVVPCDHGYCAGAAPPAIEALPAALPQPRFEAAGPTEITVHCKPQAPPPRRRS